MKVLVATHLTQGSRPGDYCFTVEGELVSPAGFECDSGEACGCERGFTGLASHKATTTAVVAELAHVNVPLLRTAVTDSLAAQGWLGLLSPADGQQLIDEHVDAIVDACFGLTPGTVVRRKHATVWPESAAA